MKFEHVTASGIREYERPDLEISSDVPTCPEHGVEMKLRKLVEVTPPTENLFFKCPVDGCDESWWLN